LQDQHLKTKRERKLKLFHMKFDILFLLNLNLISVTKSKWE